MTTTGLLINVIVSGIISVMGTIGNCFVIFPFIMSPSLRTVNNLFIIQLAIVDMIKASVVLPMKVANQANQKSSMDAKVCPIFGMLRTVGSCQSALLLGMIALVRYYKVLQPYRFCVVFSMKRSLCYSAGLVIGTLLLSSLPLFGVASYKYSFSHGACFVNWSADSIVFRTIYYIFNVGIPFPLLIFCYYKIFKALRNHSRTVSPAVVSVKTRNLLVRSDPMPPVATNEGSSATLGSKSSPRFNRSSPQFPKSDNRIHRLNVAELHDQIDSPRMSSTASFRRRKPDFEIVITKVMFVIVVVYVVCWLPAFFINILNLSKAVSIPDDILLFAVTLVDLKVMLNPIIYIFSSKRFRTHIIRAFKQF